MAFSLKEFFGQLFGSFKNVVYVKANGKTNKDETIIMTPNDREFDRELKLRTEEFQKYQMAETVKDLEKAVYHLSASVTQLKEQGKKNEELLVFLSTTQEELLHAFEEEQDKQVEDERMVTATTHQQPSEDDEDDEILNEVWESKAKGSMLN